MKKFIYNFSEGNKEMKDLLGGKGANLAEMTNIGLPIPSGFIITTEYCNYFLQNKKHHNSFAETLQKHIATLQLKIDKTFGDAKNPLLVSVRSGSKYSMPGMMDTVLNLGLNDKTVEILAKKTDNPRFAYDAYRRLLHMFGNVVLGINPENFEHKLTAYKKKKHYENDLDMKPNDWKKIIAAYKTIIQKETKKPFPQNPQEQLNLAILAVFQSWNNKRAISYRNINNIPHNLGTAVNVQSMVFGNLGQTSGTGVAFTRNPATGQKGVFGEYLFNAQGEDVVAGIRTPQPLEHLRIDAPKMYKQLIDIFAKLENHYKDMQDVEFTIEENILFILQTRTGKRTADAGIKIAVDMVKEKLITQKEAIMRIQPESLDQLLHPTFDPKAKKTILTKGLAASPGAAVGRIVLTSEDAVKRTSKDKWDVVLVRHETSAEDIEGMHVSKGILTSCGGMTSHAAVVARGMGTCCVAGASEVVINYKKRIVNIGGKILKEGDVISLNGMNGEVYSGEVKTQKPEVKGDFETIMKWADKYRKLRVHTNAETPADIETALKFGAEGIGLCRTEHMFFDKKRIPYVRAMILANTTQERKEALKKILPFQKEDFKKIFTLMKGLPVTIRLIDPPLHEFLPKKSEKQEVMAVAKALRIKPQKVVEIITNLFEINPMLGHRGCRLVITHPEIAQMQVEAIIAAACECKKAGIKVHPEIMIPLVSIEKEFDYLKTLCQKIAKEVMKKYKISFPYLIGTMIETPRAVLIADKIAKRAEFFSFGTNDLTQMSYGFSRDDAGKFISDYIAKGILPNDPFQKLDQEGIGVLMQMGMKKGRSSNKKLIVGICGEHGGEASSVKFCHKNGFNYVSCSPYRVPIARLAAAQAALE